MFNKMKERSQILSEKGCTVKHEEFDNEADAPDHCNCYTVDEKSAR